ncbi:MAG: ABC transporter permease [Acidimicrobiaceae bacterium]|nr:ABC transporter permease [Acidimicrobiaceae bacterium]
MLLAELWALLRRARVRVLLLVMAVLPVLVAVAVSVSGGPTGGQGPAFLNQVSHNGLFVALATLAISLPLIMPLTVAVVAGDTIAGEASLGTLRYLLSRPCGRVRLLLVKAVTVVAYCLLASMVTVAVGMAAGFALFPGGSVLTLSGTTLPLGQGVARTLLAAALVGVSMLGVGAVGVFVSTMTDIPLAAMAVTLGAVILSTVLDSLPEVSAIHPWLFTHQWMSFADLFRSPVRWHGIGRNLLLQGAYVAVFGTAAWSRLTTRDVLA